MKFSLRPAACLCVLGFFMASCNDLFHDDLADCPQGVYVKFYSKNICAEDSSYLGDVDRLHLFAFDDNGVLAGQTMLKKPQLTKDYEYLMPLKSGKYEFMAWVNLDDNFELQEGKPGLTTKKDIFLSLKKKAPMLLRSLDGQKIWQGGSGRNFVELPEVSEVGSFYNHAAVNLLEKTSRINITIELDESILKSKARKAEPKDFGIEIKSNRYAADYAGNADLKKEHYQYPAQIRYTEKSAFATFTLKDFQTDHEGIITLKNLKTGDVMWNGSLYGSILQEAVKKAAESGEHFNFNCQNDFQVKFKIRDKCANCYDYVCWAIFVEDWQVHSYSLELGD
ncbi:FimB/Mfa2 family fimbrial subunit [Alloprevotella sp. OH1205_COT-284]|uniref:FimB/Mfa2 family fimbrial subunit n=1 Tax=Alloprevotella sp. OH1205_COT-284 TaxID=2491043 RepID=UPI0013150827|nr:FimB/Mfa2 family fimbrial subunit [Alloprevotella sp. OH1205_COT-284]